MTAGKSQLKGGEKAGAAYEDLSRKLSIDYRLSLQLYSEGDFLSEELASGEYSEVFNGSISLSDLITLVEKELSGYDRIVGLITRDNIDVRIVIEGRRMGVAGIYSGGARPLIGAEALEVLSSVAGRAIVFARPRKPASGS